MWIDIENTNSPKEGDASRVKANRHANGNANPSTETSATNGTDNNTDTDLGAAAHIHAQDTVPENGTSAGAQSQNYGNSKEAKRTPKSERHANRDWVPARSRKSANPRLGKWKTKSEESSPRQKCIVQGLSAEKARVVERVYCGLGNGVSTPNIYRKLMQWARKIDGVGTKKKIKEDGRARRREEMQSMEEGGTMEGRGMEGERNRGGSMGEEGVRTKEEGMAAHRTPGVRKNKSQNKNSPPPHTPAPQTSPPSPPSGSPTSVPTPEKGCGSGRVSCVVGTSSGRTAAAERRSGAGVGWERSKNGVKGLSMRCRGRGRYGRRRARRKCVGRARSVGRRSTRRVEAGSTAQRSQMLMSSILGIEYLGPRTKDGLGQAGEKRAKAGGRIGELELLSVSS
ncbi:hypothetical protein B0H13DRAFT_2288521 [Mycena leptocephala]|nr:hypothetical protein B0H13DRAFT_2288521 [Mycena leptocephala]